MSDITFEHVDVKEEIVQLLKKEFPKYGYKNVKVLKADPQSASELPCIGINRINDDESHESIVDSETTKYNKVTHEYEQFFGTFFQESLEIRIWHTNADARDRLYRYTKALLFGLRTPLVEQGLLNITLRSGRDEQDSSQQQAPMTLYWSTITMSYLNPLDVRVVSIVAPVERIDAVTDMDTGEEG